MNDNGLKEYANRAYIMYELYEKLQHTRKSRKRKEYIRKMFNAWYKCPNWEGKYTEDYWGFPTKFTGTETFKDIFFDNMKVLGIAQVGKFLRLIELHVKINCK